MSCEKSGGKYNGACGAIKLRDCAGCGPAISNHASQSKRAYKEGGHGDIFLENAEEELMIRSSEFPRS